MTSVTTDIDELPPWHPSRPHHELAADVRWWMDTPLGFGLFGRLALNQVAYRKVAAAVDATGRFEANFTDRGIGSYLWNGPPAFGDEAATHPKMMELLNSSWSPAKQAEFAVYRTMIRAARRWLPKWLVLEPLAYNRYRYEQLRAFHARYDLETFAVPEERRA